MGDVMLAHNDKAKNRDILKVTQPKFNATTQFQTDSLNDNTSAI